MASADTRTEIVSSETHNYSSQVGVVRNDDPALNVANEHHHAHLHHSEFATAGKTEVAYTTGTTTDEPHVIPHQDRQDNNLKRHMEHHHDEKTGGIDIVDTEKGGLSPTVSQSDPKNHGWRRFYARYKIFIHVFIFLLFTGWWIAGLILHRYDLGWIIPFLLWLFITIRLITFWVPAAYVLIPANSVWQRTIVPAKNAIPQKLRLPLGALGAVAVFLVGAFASPESEDNTRGNRGASLLGLVIMLAVLYGTSRNRNKINWHTVIVGMLAQFIIALFVLRTDAGYQIFNFISELAVDLLGSARVGFTFLFDADALKLPYFVVSVLPAIIFFVAFVQILFYWGLLQWFITKMAYFFFWLMQVSGAEAVVAAASPFIGQGESAMLIRPFIAHLTQAEIHQIMCSGFATIAGSVLVAYISFGVSPQVLISSCVMSIPASLAISKMRWPEEEETLTAGRVVIPDDEEERAANVLHAFANGAWLGLKIAGIIAATLLCFLSLLALVDAILTWWGHYLNIYNPDLTTEMLLGYIFYPVAWLLGVPKGNLYSVGKLIGKKIIVNEFAAYADFGTLPEYQAMSPRSKLIASYALCGFGNIGSLGNQIGILSQLAPGRSGDVSRVAVSALISGILSTLTSASIAGLLVTNQ